MTPQERIKTLMATLDNTSLHGIAALDEAVRACSNFSSTQDWLDSFQKDCQDAMDDGCTTEQMVNTVCGIVRDTDTGAITGYDAGSGTIKTAVSIVPEESPASTAVMPVLGSTTTIDGLEVTWPTQEELDTAIANGANANSLNFALKGLNTWWIHESIKLGTESYGLSFTEPGTTIKTIKVNVDYQNNGTLAYVQWYYYLDTGKQFDMSLNVNLKYYNDLVETDPNGYAPTYKQEYLDRTLAHEFVHALMVANMDYISELPLIFKEGIAEFVHGIDDARPYSIAEVASDLSILKKALNLNATKGYEEYYSAGYMALHYLAKKGTIAPFVASKAAWYDNNNTTLVLRAGSAYLNGSEGTQYLSSVTTIDASGSTSTNRLVGNDKANTIIGGAGVDSIWGGSGSSDLLEGGSGADTFFFGSTDGTDTVTHYDAAKDTVDIYTNDISSVSTSGTDILLGAGASTLTLKDATGAQVKVAYQNGYTCNAWFGSDTVNSVNYSTSLNFYYGSANTKNTLSISEQNAKIWLNNTTSTFYKNIDNLDASTATGDITLAGNESANLIKGGKGYSSIWGGAGELSDTLQGGSGRDTFYLGCNEGNDYITDSSNVDKVIFYDPSMTFTSLSMAGTCLVISTANNSSLSIIDWSENDMNTFQLANGRQYKLHNQNDGTVSFTLK